MKHFFLSLLIALSILPAAAQEAPSTWGQTPRLSVVGNHLETPDGHQVMLHGIMDTPSPYFCGYRFTDGHWINVYSDGDNYLTKCKNYFNKLFTAATDTAQGSWCNVFRLHMDPCWTDNPNVHANGFRQSGDKLYDPHNQEVSGEASIYHFDLSRLRTYLSQLYLPIAKLANGHGMYVIMRPPGVCPRTIQVGDYYQKYLLDVWDTASRSVTAKSYSDWLSFELANEPIEILDANGQRSDHAMYDFFQPIVEKIRANGFKGIIWIPGGTWQQDYKGYKNYPIEGEDIGYAVHFYPGWYSTSDAQYDRETSIRAFLNNVPVVKTAPIMITEVDWSPEDKVNKVIDHYNEYGQPVYKNCGTWATGSTSKFGVGYRAVLEYFDNIGMTLTHTHDYMDIDRYLADKTLLPAFHNILPNNAWEACSGACFQWYREFAHQQHTARTDFSEFEISYTPDKLFPLTKAAFNPSIWENGSFNEATRTLTTGQYGFGGWQYPDGLDLSMYKYIVLQFQDPVKDDGSYSPSFRLFDENNYWAGAASYNLGGKTQVVVDLHNMKKDNGATVNPSHLYIIGFWTLGGAANSLTIGNIFVSNDGKTPVASLSEVIANQQVTGSWRLDGQRALPGTNGLIIERLEDGTMRKVLRR